MLRGVCSCLILALFLNTSSFAADCIKVDFTRGNVYQYDNGHYVPIVANEKLMTSAKIKMTKGSRLVCRYFDRSLGKVKRVDLVGEHQGYIVEPVMIMVGKSDLIESGGGVRSAVTNDNMCYYFERIYSLEGVDSPLLLPDCSYEYQEGSLTYKLNGKKRTYRGKVEEGFPADLVLGEYSLVFFLKDELIFSTQLTVLSKKELGEQLMSIQKIYLESLPSLKIDQVGLLLAAGYPYLGEVVLNYPEMLNEVLSEIPVIVDTNELFYDEVLFFQKIKQ